MGFDPVGTLSPIVQCAGGVSEPLELSFQRTIVRGGRLDGCLNAVQPGPIGIVADQFRWSVGAAKWPSVSQR